MSYKGDLRKQEVTQHNAQFCVVCMGEAKENNLCDECKEIMSSPEGEPDVIRVVGDKNV